MGHLSDPRRWTLSDRAPRARPSSPLASDIGDLVSHPLLEPIAFDEFVSKERVVGHESLGLCARVGLEGDQPSRPVPEG